MEESKQLAVANPEFDYVVSAGGPPEPPAEPSKIGKQRLVEVGHKGQFVMVIGFYGRGKAVKYQRVPLDSRFGESEDMKTLMSQYQEQLQQLGWSGLGIKPMKHPRTLSAKGKDPLEGQFAGAASCKECHPTAYGIWSKTKHAHASETLTKLDPPRQYDAECISCHSTGWDPQGYFPYITGFDSLDSTPHLTGNSCENCHGPGAAHVAAEKGKSSPKRAAQRTAMQLTAGLAKTNVCVDCHDHDNSPEFDFEKYWPKVAHKGKR
jgi:cytochrome c554/c'-like protein